MKYKSPLIFLTLLCLLFSGCSNASNGNTAFYYLNEQANYGIMGTAIDSERRAERTELSEINQILSQYLKGPRSSDLKNPFPDGTTLISATIDQGAVRVILSDELAALTGVDLSIACACMTLTVKSITGYAKVEIRSQNASLNGQDAIIMDANSLQLSDFTH